MGYIYLKSSDSPRFVWPKFRFSVSLKTRKILAGLFFCFGIFLFASAVFPIVQFQFEYSSKFGQIINPLSAKFYNQGDSILGSQTTTDYTQLNNWFAAGSGSTATVNSLEDTNLVSYRLSIPTLKIKDAVVSIGSMDLKKSLIQYPQTALPGQLGNGVVFGHSVLPQFFNPKSYLTIFSTLYRLKLGDEIVVDYGNIQYKYLVEEMYEVTPTDLSVLEQRYDGRYLSLITCSPPGTYLRRLVVRSRVVEN